MGNPNPVYIDFIIRGTPNVHKAFKSVEQAALAAERSQTVRARAESTQRQRITDQEAKGKVKAEERAARDRARIQDRSATMAGRLAAQSARNEIRAEERAGREKVRIEEKTQRDRMRIRERSASMAGRFAAQEAAREKREAASAARADLSARQRFAKGLGGAASSAGRTMLRGGVQLAGMVSQLGGGFSVADSVQQQIGLERSALTLSNAAYMGKGQRMDPAAIMGRARSASVATGTDASELLQAAHAFGSKTGNYNEGLEQMNLFGQISKGTGTSLEDVAKTAGILRVQNKKLDPKAMEQLLLQTIRQGQLGSIEFADLAHAAGKITRTSSSYAGDQATNQGKLLGLAQVAMRTSGSPEEAATVLSNISADAMKHHDDVSQRLGRGTFTKNGQIAKAPEEFIADVMAKTGGNLQTIQSMGFGARSMKMFQALAPTFNDAEQEKKGSGREAILKDIREVSAGSMSMRELQDNVTKVLNSSGEKFEAAMRELRTVVGSELLPELVKLVPVIKDATPHVKQLLESFIKLAQWAESHPFAGLGLAVTGLITKEIATAQIGELLKKLLSGGGGGPGGGAGGPGGAAGGGTGAALGAGAAAAAATYMIAKPGVDAVLNGQTSGQFRAGALESDIRNGSDADRANAIAEVQKARDEYGGASGIMKMAGAAIRMPNEAVYSAITGEKNEAAETLKKAMAAREIIDSEGIKQAISRAVADGAKQGMRNGAASDNPARGGSIVQRNGIK